MASTKEAIVICLDVGPWMREKSDPNDKETPLQIAIECIQWILQRRIFGESKDEIGMVLFGTPETKNPLASQDQYQNVMIFGELQTVDWQFVKMLQNEIPAESVEADFVDGLVVALDLLYNSTEKKKFAQKSLVLFSNFGASFSDDQIGAVIKAMKNYEVDFAAIGPEFDGENSDVTGGPARKLSDHQIKGRKLVEKIADETDGTCLSLQQALPLLSYFSRRQVKPMAWKCNLELGNDIRIPICMYLKTKENKLKQTWKWMNAQDSTAEISAVRTYHKKATSDDNNAAADGVVTDNGDKNATAGTGATVNGSVDTMNDKDDGENAKQPDGDEVEKEEMVKAYRYGTSLVPLDKIDIDTVKYKSDSKCLRILAFTEKRTIKRYYFMDDGSHVVFADSSDEVSSSAFSAFVRALEELKFCAIVRYVYNVRSNPKICALIPEIDAEGSQYFVFIPLPFSEDCRFFSFASLNDDKIKPSENQVNAMDSFIDAMDLNRMSTDADGEVRPIFNLMEIVNPHIQYIFQCLQHRVLNPDKPLPEPSVELLATINPSAERLKLAKPAIDAVKDQFKLTKIVKTEKRAAAEVFKTGDYSIAPKKVHVELGPMEYGGSKIEDQQRNAAVKISTVRPVEDFVQCLEANVENFVDAASQLSDIIRQFVFDCVGSQLYTKALECLEIFRQKSKELSQPGCFNRFINTLKFSLLDGGKNDFWQEICTKQFGLIYDEETSSSQVSKQEAENFLKPEEKPAESEKPKTDAENLQENLLDELE